MTLQALLTTTPVSRPVSVPAAAPLPALPVTTSPVSAQPVSVSPISPATVSPAPISAVPDSATDPVPEQEYIPLKNYPRAGQRLTKEELDPLVRNAAAGDPTAVTSLLEVIRAVAARYCRARLGGRDLSYLSADDVAQEVCLAVLQALPAYQDRGGSFLYLVHAIASNKVADAYRAVSRDRSDPVPELPERTGAGNEPELHALHADLGARLGKLVSTLPKLQQEILALRIAVGLTAAETAEALGISPGNVRVTQHRAITKLRGMISAEDDF